MAKKNTSNVIIKDEELTPTTIGFYSNKTKNPIGILLLIAIFILIVVFLPDIQVYINKLLGKSDTSETTYTNNNNNNNHIVDPDDEDDLGKKYDILSTTSIDTKSYALSNISLNNNVLSFEFNNKNTNDFDLSDYFLELYSIEGTFINRIKVSNDLVSNSNPKVYSFNVSPSVSTLSFIKKTVNDYPQVSLNYDENEEAKLICRSNNLTYSYLFLDDKLTNIYYTYNLSKDDDPEYYNSYQEYKNKSDSYNLINGVTSSISDTISSFYFTVQLDLSNEDLDLSKLNDDNLFKFKTEPKVVKFIEEAKGFTCQQE